MLNTFAEKPGDAQLKKVFEISVSLLLDAKDMFITYRSVDLEKDIRTLIKRCQNEGLSFFTRTLPNLSKGLLQHLENNSGNYPNFAKKGNHDYPAFLSGIFVLAYDTRSVDHERAVGFIYQFSNSFKKLKGTYDDAILRSQMEEFVSVDQSLPEIFNEADFEIIRQAQDIIGELFSAVNADEEILFNNIIPRPGPGATNTPVALHERYRFNNIYTQLNSFFSFDEWFYPTYHEYSWDIPHFRIKYENAKDMPRARFKFVDKIVGKARGICIEENEMQYFQQGLKAFLYKWIESHPMTKGKINFTFQEVNRQLAHASSISRLHATIDMKDASDRISRKLVEILFEKVPILKDALLHLSTRVIDISAYADDDDLYCKKYAAMGSGLCFPVMSIVHYALIRAMINLSMQPADSLQQIYIYGDDIIIPSPCIQVIYDWLPRFGMKVNCDKSFHNSFFRESCGIHAVNGLDITPVYFKYTPESIAKTVSLESLIANEALLYTKGYFKTAALIRRHKTLPYVNERSPACGWKRPQDILSRSFSDLEVYRKRWNDKLHKTEYFLPCFVEHTEENILTNDSCMYLRALLIKAHSHDGFKARSFVKKRRVWLSINMIK